MSTKYTIRNWLVLIVYQFINTERAEIKKEKLNNLVLTTGTPSGIGELAVNVLRMFGGVMLR